MPSNCVVCVADVRIPISALVCPAPELVATVPPSHVFRIYLGPAKAIATFLIAALPPAIRSNSYKFNRRLHCAPIQRSRQPDQETRAQPCEAGDR